MDGAGECDNLDFEGCCRPITTALVPAASRHGARGAQAATHPSTASAASGRLVHMVYLRRSFPFGLGDAVGTDAAVGVTVLLWFSFWSSLLIIFCFHYC